MALTHKTSVFNIDDAKIAPLTADPSGGAPTYGTSLDVPGIKSIAIDPDVLTKELYGDATVLAQFAKVRKINSRVSHARLDLDVWSLLTGAATATDSGTTPNQTTTWDLKGASQPGLFKLEFQIKGVDFVTTGTADLHVILWKCRITDFTGGGQEEDFAIPGFDISAVRLDSNDKLLSVVFNETAVAIA